MTDTKESGAGTRVGAVRRPAYATWSKTFLAHLASTSNVTSSARKAKISVSTVYETRRAKPDFNQRWQAALLEGYEHLEMELLHRLRAGEQKEIGEKAPRKKKTAFDNGTAFRLLSLHRETVAHQRALQDDDDEEVVLASIDAKLDRMRHRQLDEAGDDAAQ